ncbi:hypothetical protein PENTCL1PPCAC_18667 [Pristionchus entomophagus]|uniref:G protein-coupled receptor n=1 Tax=Pristionchus entomophagus TaxID=358040 RepID=A0AAV5TQ17_9BILA|nr:hypothetical protein PENTCL1PPCAC_18667 [Pristionchus entomophagus]
MSRFRIFRCHVTVLGIFFDCLNFVLFLFFLIGTGSVQASVQDQCNNGTPLNKTEQQKCRMAVGLLIYSIVLSIVEILSTGLLITAVLYNRGKLVIIPLIVTCFNILDALVFSIISIMDVSSGRKIGAYIMDTLFGSQEYDGILAASITLSCLLVIALLYCILNFYCHIRIWQYYKWKREREKDEFSETTSQVSIIATFSMDMIFDELRRKEDRTITSIAEEDEDEEEREQTTDLW